MMRLREYTIEQLADMVVGNHDAFPYRSSHFITTFFIRCDLPYRHDGSTRGRWAKGVLMQLNLGPGRSSALPSESLVRVITELFDPDDFDRAGKFDAGGTSSGNAANVLTQVRMAIDHPLFDPDANRKVLLDHVFVIAAGEITRAARNWLVEHLDAGQRRHIIFMDRAELLDHSAGIVLDLPAPEMTDDDIPF